MFLNETSYLIDFIYCMSKCSLAKYTFLSVESLKITLKPKVIATFCNRKFQHKALACTIQWEGTKLKYKTQQLCLTLIISLTIYNSFFEVVIKEFI